MLRAGCLGAFLEGRPPISSLQSRAAQRAPAAWLCDMLVSRPLPAAVAMPPPKLRPLPPCAPAGAAFDVPMEVGQALLERVEELHKRGVSLTAPTQLEPEEDLYHVGRGRGGGRRCGPETGGGRAGDWWRADGHRWQRRARLLWGRLEVEGRSCGGRTQWAVPAGRCAGVCRRQGKAVGVLGCCTGVEPCRPHHR